MGYKEFEGEVRQKLRSIKVNEDVINNICLIINTLKIQDGRELIAYFNHKTKELESTKKGETDSRKSVNISLKITKIDYYIMLLQKAKVI